MKTILVLLLIVGAALAADQVPVNSEIVEILKSSQSTWVPMEAKENPFFGMTEERIKGYLGLRLDKKPQGIPKVSYKNLLKNIGIELPDSFNPIQKWGKCIHEIRNQLHCGSCWAFAATESLSDRFCIASEGKIDEILSPQDMVSCDEEDFGCGGGYLDRAFKYLESTGVVSEACFPYTSGEGTEEHCLHGSCTDKHVPFVKFRCAEDTVKILADVESIKLELMTNGPMETGFMVYEDFMNYKSGVYKYTTGRLLGGHAIKVIGWGEENGEQHWICSNSWGIEWGESGFFKIKMNECGIDDTVLGCTPEFSHIPHFDD